MLNYPTHYTSKINMSPLQGLRTEIDRLFDDLWTAPRMNDQQMPVNDWQPACDVVEAEGHYLISLELAGVSKDQVKIDIHENKVTVSGERGSGEKKKSGETWYTERQFGKFTRSFTLPSEIDSDKVEAHFRDGVLSVFVPKSTVSKRREVKISDETSTGFFGRLIGASSESQKGKLAS